MSDSGIRDSLITGFDMTTEKQTPEALAAEIKRWTHVYARGLGWPLAAKAELHAAIDRLAALATAQQAERTCTEATPEDMRVYGAMAAQYFRDTAQQTEPVAVVYPPDGTVSPFTVINLGFGAVQMGDCVHDERLPGLWFGKNGQGMGHEDEMNREAHEGETIAVVTFLNVEGLDVLLSVLQRIRMKSFPTALATAQQAERVPLTEARLREIAEQVQRDHADVCDMSETTAFARAIEAAHGIE